MEEKTDRIYSSLKTQYSLIKNAIQIQTFAEIEAVIYLMYSLFPDSDLSKAHLMFTKYELIGAESLSEATIVLYEANQHLSKYRSKKLWNDSLEEYRSEKYDGCRLFRIEEALDKSLKAVVCENTPYSFDKRTQELCIRLVSQAPQTIRQHPPYAKKGLYSYKKYAEKEESNPYIYLSEDNCISEIPYTDSSYFYIPKGVREPIKITVGELKETALKMHDIDSSDYCYQVENIIKSCKGGKVTDATEIELKDVTNIIGMVGSGKSTLIKVIAYWCSLHNKKIVIILNAVSEVINLYTDLNKLHIKCSPLIGSSERNKYIKQVYKSGKTTLDKTVSQYLCPSCIVDGITAHSSEPIDYGKEPCYKMANEKGKTRLCKFFNCCNGTKMLRECYTSNVVITTAVGFANIRVGPYSVPFLNVAIDSFDLVIFDEADRVQRTLDRAFVPEIHFNEYIKSNAENIKDFLSLSSAEKNEDNAIQEYYEASLLSEIALSTLVRAIKKDLGSWNKVSSGDIFSSYTLIGDLFEKNTVYKIPIKVKEALDDLVSRSTFKTEKYNPLEEAVQVALATKDQEALFDARYLAAVNKFGNEFIRPENEKNRVIQDNRIKLIIKLVAFDRYISSLEKKYEACKATIKEEELSKFMRTRFTSQQKYLPSSLVGNLFGIRKTIDDDIELFRQYAFGRSLMKDLPWLKIDCFGNPTGPISMLLSGSSWVEGSYEYHVNRPVDYIIEASAEKRAFLEKAKFYELATDERVSGTTGNKKLDNLRKVIERSAILIDRELSKPDGKVLLVVNSYEQAQIVQSYLESRGYSGVCRLVSDSVDEENIESAIKRGEIGSFAKKGDKILIAPAMAIERGHNIVDEQGHSALTALFFLVRPMARPDDLIEWIGKLNGYIEVQCLFEDGETILEHNARIRMDAAKYMIYQEHNNSYSLSALDEDEKKDVVATLFVIILQIFGRLARVTDTTKAPPNIYFSDGAFHSKTDNDNGFDCLKELEAYLDELMKNTENSEIAQTLYGPFYKAFKRREII